MRPVWILLGLFFLFMSIPVSFSLNIAEDDCTSNFTTVTRGGEQSGASGIKGPSAVDQFAYGVLHSGDIENKLGIMHLLGAEVAVPQLYITRVFFPNPLMADENETVAVNTTVKVNHTETDIYMINTTDQIPWDFTPPSEQGVRVYFIDYTPYAVTDITGNATVNVSILDQSGSLPTLLMVNISNISQTDAGGYMQENDSILLVYDIVSSRMNAGSYRILYTNATVRDNQSRTASGYALGNITAFVAVLRGYKTITTPDPGDPQILSIEIKLYALGGPLSDIYISDFLPQGAQISGLNVTYYNQTTSAKYSLYNDSDYYLEDPFQDTLPDGTYADVYFYNFSYNFTNWDGNLYDNDSITITYNATVLGGGQWILPALISGFDPQYRKHITTEMHAEADIPLFDIVLTTLTEKVKPGEVVNALLRMTNMGGPMARVDVFLTYSAKTMNGNLVVERSDTFAVTNEKERELSLKLPSVVPPGMYTFEALVTYTGREALSTDIFEVLGAPPESPGFMLYAVIGVLAFAVLFLALRSRTSSSGRLPAEAAGPGER